MGILAGKARVQKTINWTPDQTAEATNGGVHFCFFFWGRNDRGREDPMITMAATLGHKFQVDGCIRASLGRCTMEV